MCLVVLKKTQKGFWTRRSLARHLISAELFSEKELFGDFNKGHTLKLDCRFILYTHKNNFKTSVNCLARFFVLTVIYIWVSGRSQVNHSLHCCYHVMAFNFYLDGEFISIAIVLLSDPSSVFFVIFLPIPFIRSLIRSFFFVFFSPTGHPSCNSACCATNQRGKRHIMWARKDEDDRDAGLIIQPNISGWSPCLGLQLQT